MTAKDMNDKRKPAPLTAEEYYYEYRKGKEEETITMVDFAEAYATEKVREVLEELLTTQKAVKQTQNPRQMKAGDYVRFAKAWYEIAGFHSNGFIMIYDEPPSEHIDLINPDSIQGWITNEELKTLE